MYIPDSEMANPYARPVIADNFSNLPPAYVHTAQHDPIRDDGEIYANKLRAAGNDVVYHCAENMIHGFLRARLLGPGGGSMRKSPIGCAATCNDDDRCPP